MIVAIRVNMLVFLVCLFLSEIHGVYVDVPFEDPYPHHRFTFPDETIADWDHLPSKSPVSLFVWNNGNSLIYLTSTSIYIGERSSIFKWKKVEQDLGLLVDDSFSLFMDSEGEGLVAGSSTITRFNCTTSGCSIISKISVNIGKVNEIVVDAKGNDYFIATSKGLFLSDGYKMTPVLEDISASSVAIFDTQVAMGTDEKLYLFEISDVFDQSKWWFYWVGGVIGEKITSVRFSSASQKLYVGNKVCVNELDLKTLQWTRLGGRTGLPYHSVTEIMSAPNKVFFGTEKGVILRDLKTSEWHYFFQDRWIHGEEILSLSYSIVDDGSLSVFILSSLGCSELRFRLWTLAEKAEFYESLVYPRHDRYGLVSDVGLKNYGDLSSYFKKSSDNDGLWTSVYLTSQIFRFASTNREEAKTAAWKAFRGMQLLHNVTGLRGFMARSVLPRGAPLPGGEWFNSTIYHDLQFKGDTSSDEVIGHINAFSLFYDLVAESQEEKKMVAELVDNVVSYIISNEYRLLDYDGKPTTWGMWRPYEINTVAKWMTDRGLNSLEILGFILSAYRITGKQIYLDSFRYLVEENGYARNVINQKIEVIGDVGPSNTNINHSDDELSFLSFLISYYALQFLPDKEFDYFRDCLDLGIEKNYEHVRNERSPMFDLIYGFSKQSSSKFDIEDFDVSNTIWTLKNYPQSLINWPYDNTQRIDVVFNPEPFVREKISNDENMRVLPYNEIGCSRWNCNPFTLKGGNGYSETDPGVWLFGYWMAKYYKFIQ